MGAAYCPSCGASVAPGSAACGACGHDVSRPARSTLADANACPSCASLLSADARFCRSCGERVAPDPELEPEPAPPPEVAPVAPAPPPEVAPAGPVAPAPPPEVAPVAPAPPPEVAPAAPVAPNPLAAFAPSGAPDQATGPPPLAVPRPSVDPAPPPPPPPPPAFVTYNALPPSTPPIDTAALLESDLKAPTPLPAPEVQAAPPPAPPPATTSPPVAAAPPASPKPPKRPREPLSRGAIVAGVITAVLLVGSGLAVLLLSGGEDPKPAAARSAPATPEPEQTARPKPARSDAGLQRQVLTLDGLMEKSRQGRAAAAKGDTKAAIANRSALLKDLEQLSGQAKDARLKAGLASFTAAIRESLRQNRECGDVCAAGDLEKVNDLKRETVDALNPLLRKYAKTTYRGRDI